MMSIEKMGGWGRTTTSSIEVSQITGAEWQGSGDISRDSNFKAGLLKAAVAD